jgi:hypothetical protein
MINDFLARLDNIAGSPGDIVWPTFTPRIISTAEGAVRNALIGTGLGRREHFLRCVQLTYGLMNSPLSDVITARDQRITYTTDTLRALFAVSVGVVTARGVSPVPNLVFGTSPQTPDVGSWFIEVISVGAGTAEVRMSDDRGSQSTAAFSYTDRSPVITLPSQRGVITFYGSQFHLHDTWTIIRQVVVDPWILEAAARLPGVETSLLGLMSARLEKVYRAAPLTLDKLAAAVATLGGAE